MLKQLVCVALARANARYQTDAEITPFGVEISQLAVGIRAQFVAWMQGTKTFGTRQKPFVSKCRRHRDGNRCAPFGFQTRDG
ncbi:hypothetical protein AABC73_14245 [Pseudomonas sp. G.S.17]|uniref:hypothetical protein n=1 Tax=Pseudomonas sp. G.S.17 TaxID=3137451 RepID=UPI00311CDC6D